VAGRVVRLRRQRDVVIETAWEDLGRIIERGGARALAGAPRPLAGHGRDRFVYASLPGLRTSHRIGVAGEGR
jgi:xanthine dehydrogenase accessory factor